MSIVFEKPASPNGVPLVTLILIIPPSSCCNVIAFVLASLVAVNLLIAKAFTSETKVSAVVPDKVTVCAVHIVPFAWLTEIVKA